MMGQAEVIEYLEMQKGKLCGWKDIYMNVPGTKQNVSRALNKIVKREEIIAVYVYSDKTNRMAWMYGVRM